LNPIEQADHPTSHITVPESRVHSADEIAKVENDGAAAYFYLKREDDGLAGTIGNNFYHGEGVKKLFNGFTPGKETIIDTDTSPERIIPCDKAVINAPGTNRNVLDRVLREEQYLLHPISETAEIGGELVEFTVVDLEPLNNTVRVTAETEIEFTEEHEKVEEAAAGSPVGGSGSDGADATGTGENGSEDEDSSTIDITPTNPQVSFEEDVAGLDEVKQTAQMMLSLFEPGIRDEVVERYGKEFADRGGGMLLYGPPGCGKTLVSEAIAYEAKHNTSIEANYGNVVFMEVRASDVVSKYSGESEKNIRAAFEQAHQKAQDGFAILFFDEVETLIPDRSDDNLQRHERALTNAFLQEMNDVEDNLLVIGATNMPFSIDPAATRRFPIQQFIPQPDAEVMEQVWAKSLGKIGESLDDEDLSELGAASTGYTPAEIADRILGSELQRELIQSVVDGEPVTPDKNYLLDRLNEMEPKTVRQYVNSVGKQASELEGYPEMKQYIEDQVARMYDDGTDGDKGASPEPAQSED
jgi:transitional endoplasmic reticulum ATPase